jgi:hypothetical protein
MGLFKCRGCEARDREIIHLLSLLEEARKSYDKLITIQAEMVSPGASGRAIPRPKTPAMRAAELKPLVKPTTRTAKVGFPGYERERPGEDLEIG